MNRHTLFSRPCFGRCGLALLASTAIFSAGCSNMVSTAPESGPLAQAGSVTGRVHGGNQAVAFATVNLYFQGLGRPNPAASLQATTATANNGAGSFSFTLQPTGSTTTGGNNFQCPASPNANSMVYLVATGGNTMGTGTADRNNAAVFLAPLGPCASIGAGTTVDMSEVVTAASVTAFQQFLDFTPGFPSISSDNIFTSTQALINAYTNLSTNLVDLSTGLARTSTTHTIGSTSSASGITVTATPETAKINLIANILSACVNNPNSSAANCTTLFNNAVPPDPIVTANSNRTFSTATDVLMAAYYMATNPTSTTSGTSHLAAIYALSPATGAPYQPTLTTQPSDFTVGIQYASAGTCHGLTSGPDTFINSPYDLNVDLNGFLWISNSASHEFTLMSPNGTPYQCLDNAATSQGAAIDQHGNVWWADYTTNNAGSGSLFRASSAAVQNLTITTLGQPLAVTADGQGNVFFSVVGSNSLYEVPAAATITSPVTPVQISTQLGANSVKLVVDRSGSIFAATGSASITRVTPTTNTGDPNYLNGYSSTTFAEPVATFGVGSTASVGYTSNTPGTNGIFTTSALSDEANLLTGSGTTYSAGSGFPTTSHFAGVSGARGMAIDGAQNLWVANSSPDAYSGRGTISEIALSGAALSPSPSGSTSGGFQKAASLLANSRSVVIDQGGNVWVGLNGSSSITEIVGAAVPIYQPYAQGLDPAIDRFQLIP